MGAQPSYVVSTIRGRAYTLRCHNLRSSAQRTEETFGKLKNEARRSGGALRYPSRHHARAARRRGSQGLNPSYGLLLGLGSLCVSLMTEATRTTGTLWRNRLAPLRRR